MRGLFVTTRHYRVKIESVRCCSQITKPFLILFMDFMVLRYNNDDDNNHKNNNNDDDYNNNVIVKIY